MSKFLRVPWIRWKRFRVGGVVRVEGSREPLAGLRVAAFDQDFLKDDYLGDAETDAEGRFEIRFDDSAFKDLTESQPDLYLFVFPPEGTEPIVDTSYDVRENASEDEFFEIDVPRSALENRA